MKSQENCKNYTFIAPCHFGMESILKKELLSLGCEITLVEDGRVRFRADITAIARTNMYLRSAERVLLQIGSFHADNTDDFFEQAMELPIEAFIKKDARFWVAKATSVSSNVFGSTYIQKTIKKAFIERLKRVLHTEIIHETGIDMPLRVSVYKNEVIVGLDLTGDSLHKRGYRTEGVTAPISETLAAALIMLTPWRAERILIDPFCGSGTIPIEAALIAANIAPGINRRFISESYTHLLEPAVWQTIRNEAENKITTDINTDIQGFDIDNNAIQYSIANAKRAGVENIVHFQRRALCDLSHRKPYGFIITNPPYGQRIDEADELFDLYKELGEKYRELDNWSLYLISAYADAVSAIGTKPNKNRKVYNGMLKAYYYQYFGQAPTMNPRSVV